MSFKIKAQSKKANSHRYRYKDHEVELDLGVTAYSTPGYDLDLIIDDRDYTFEIPEQAAYQLAVKLMDFYINVPALEARNYVYEEHLDAKMESYKRLSEFIAELTHMADSLNAEIQSHRDHDKTLSNTFNVHSAFISSYLRNSWESIQRLLPKRLK